MFLLDMVVLENTESIQVVVVWPVVNTTTESTSTNTILVTSYVPSFESVDVKDC